MNEPIFQENYSLPVDNPVVVFTEQSNSVIWYS